MTTMFNSVSTRQGIDNRKKVQLLEAGQYHRPHRHFSITSLEEVFSKELKSSIQFFIHPINHNSDIGQVHNIL
jgi:hypothetical protein